MLKENEVLEELDLGNCDLKTTTILHLANVLQSYNTSLLSLNISSPLLFSEEVIPPSPLFFRLFLFMSYISGLDDT